MTATRQMEVPLRFTQPREVDEVEGTPGGGSGNGWGTATPPEIVVTAKRECSTAAAEELAGHIKAQVDGGDNFEFVSVIVRNSDGLYGAFNDGIHTDYDEKSALADFPEDRSLITGILHNHIRFGTLSDRYENRYPSDGNWNNLHKLVNPPFGATPANPSELSLYLLDSYGALREFKYADRDRYTTLSQQDRINGFNLPDETDGCND